jgi:protein-disulfide isomerase
VGSDPASRGEGSRRGRWLVLAALFLLGAGLFAGIVVLSVTKPEGRLVIRGGDTAQRVYGGLSQDGARLGDPDAPITITLFDDLQCSSCAAYFLETTPRLVEDLVRTRRARLVFRHFSLSGRDTAIASFAAEAAGEQGRQWQYIQVFLANQGKARRTGVTERFMTRVAEETPNLDVDRWRADRSSAAVERAVEADGMLATELRLPAAPAALVDGPRGTRKLVESPSLAEIERAASAVG